MKTRSVGRAMISRLRKPAGFGTFGEKNEGQTGLTLAEVTIMRFSIVSTFIVEFSSSVFLLSNVSYPFLPPPSFLRSFPLSFHFTVAI